MIRLELRHIALRLFLNAADLFCGFFLFGGGLRLIDRPFAVGYLVMAAAIFLLYLSSGVWTSSKWKLKLRLGFYGLATGFSVLSVALSVFYNRIRVEWPEWVAVVVLLVVFIVSAFHLRLVVQSRGSSLDDRVRPPAK